MFDIVKRPLVTEKNTLHGAKYNEYAFEVALDANRTQDQESHRKTF